MMHVTVPRITKYISAKVATAMAVAMVNLRATDGWTPHGEQELRWTALHAQYVAIVEAGIATALNHMRCTADEVFEHARSHGGDPATDRLLSKLVATADYATFCELMLAVHRCGGMGV